MASQECYQEIWKPIDGYDGVYEVSSMGRVRSFKSGKWGLTNNPKILNGLTESYRYVILSDGKTKKSFTVHSLVASAFIPNQNNLKEINHIDGNKLNNRVDNLEWCTHAQNMAHAVDSGLFSSRKVRNKKTGQVFPNVRLAAIDANVSRMCLRNYLFGDTSPKKIRKRQVLDYEFV